MTATAPIRSQPIRSQSDRSDQSRGRILDAAIREFSLNGMAGARTEQIAEAAGVNKALLYYYFTSKQALYDAALEVVADRVVTSSMAAMSAGCSAGERLVQFALNHFDRIHSQRDFQSLMQQEMIRLHRGEENALAPLVEKVFRPMMSRVGQVYQEGCDDGELIQVDKLQIVYAALGANVFYFLSAPVMGLLTGANPFDREALEFRRTAAVEYLGKTIFIDREHGAQVAARVLAGTPMPEPRDAGCSPFHAQVFEASEEHRRKLRTAKSNLP
ncbi:MAG TPA: TetR/AcrR family transcriptional regulator [Terracidiphilus sp.]|jgi:TetR/AcrR family transcriptional regulator